jgi:hypothetical protein
LSIHAMNEDHPRQEAPSSSDERRCCRLDDFDVLDADSGSTHGFDSGLRHPDAFPQLQHQGQGADR